MDIFFLFFVEVYKVYHLATAHGWKTKALRSLL